MDVTPISPRRRAATLAVACLAAMLLAIDLTVLHLAIPKLVADLAPSGNEVLWIADAYGFALGGLLVLMGNVGDRIGRRRLLLAGSAAFGAASLVTAYAPTPELLIAARALLGVAGATIMPSTLSILRNVYTDPRQRAAAVGLWSGITAAGFALGPVVGGLLLGHFWWGSVFLVNLPVVAVVLVAGALVLPESRNPRPGPIDVTSALLSVVGVVAVIYAVKEATHGGVDQARVWVAAVAGVAGLVVFARRQTRLAHPLIDVRLFRDRAFSASVAATLIAMFASLASSVILSQYMQLVLGWSPLRAGLAGLPGAAAGVVGAVVAAPLVAGWGRARVVATGLAMTALGFALYTRIDDTSGYLTMLPAMLVFGLGLGATFATTNDTVLASVPRERAGAASAIAETATEVGGALGIGVLGVVLNSSYRAHLDLPPGLPADAGAPVRESLGTAVHAALALPGELGGAVVEAARRAFVDGLHVTVVVSAALLAALAVTALVALRGVPTVIDDRDTDPVPGGPAHDGAPVR